MPMGETIKTCVFWLTTASCISGLSQIREFNAMKCEGIILTFVFCMLVIHRGYLEECTCVVVTKIITQEIAENACIGRWHWVVGARRALKAAFRFMVRVSRFISLFLLTFKIFLGSQHTRRYPNHLKLHQGTNYPATKMDKDQYRWFLVLDIWEWSIQIQNGYFREYRAAKISMLSCCRRGGFGGSDTFWCLDTSLSQCPVNDIGCIEPY